jgi:hypothetical protein
LINLYPNYSFPVRTRGDGQNRYHNAQRKRERQQFFHPHGYHSLSWIILHKFIIVTIIAKVNLVFPTRISAIVCDK